MSNEIFNIQTVRVEGMHCASCGMLVDDALEEVFGVVSSHTNVRRKETTYIVDPKLSEDERAATRVAVAAAITSCGYQASDAPAAPEATGGKFWRRGKP